MKPKADSMKKISLLALIALLAAATTIAQAREDDSPLDSTDLRATREGTALAWPLEVFMDGAAYSWRIHFPSGVDYESALVAVREGTGPWKLLDEKGRLRNDSASLGLLTLLQTSAEAKTYPSEASPLEMGMEEDEAYYFPGWTVNNFQLAKGLADGSEAFTPLARKRMLEQVLPSPSLLNPKEAVSVMVALKRSGSDTVDGLAITTEAEYIKGERAFFNKEAYRGSSYTAKALALFASTFGTEAGYLEYRNAALASFPGTSVDWAIFDADPELPLMQHRLITHFLNTVLSATRYSEDTRLFTGADGPTWFETLYGINRLPEIASYIGYSYEVNQPLFVSSLEEANSEYDYTAFSPISQAEGIELARAALRGYTWGVEYFLPTKESLKPITGNLVYEDNKSAIQAWTAYDESNLSRESNYAATTYPLDLATVPGTMGLPQGWANGLNLDSPFASGKAGYPLPFARGGKASPRDFARGMMVAAASQRAMKYSLPPEGAGLDALGLLTSALAQTSLMGRVESLEEDYPAESLDEYYRTGQVPTAPIRFLREDIEKLSLLLPDLSQIRVGDLLVHYGEEEGQSRDSFKLGIVVYAPLVGRPLPGQDGSAFFKNVVVLGVNEGERQVGLYTWSSNGTSRGFSQKPEGWQLRRLVAKPAPVTQAKSQTMGIMRSFGAEGMNVNSAVSYVERAKITIKKIDSNIELHYTTAYESTCTSINKLIEKSHWIPNTGEYLVLGALKIVAFNKEGNSRIDFGAVTQDRSFTVKIGAIDRGYDKTQLGSHNIYNNQGIGFEVSSSTKEDFSNGFPDASFKLVNKMDGTYEFQPIMRDNKEPVLILEKMGRISIGLLDSTTKAVDKVLTPYYAIRPLPGSAFPGDDILFTATIEFKNGKKLEASANLVTGDNSYLAVYDKKMLWRANLYINEKDVKDWNDIYPWNAPPDAATAITRRNNGTLPTWWSDVWGYNEWNRKTTTSTFFDKAGSSEANGLLDLSAGDGNQVITFPTYTPLHPISEKANFTDARVAYSFPLHGLEPSLAKPGWAGSMDDPFDFKLKLLYQNELAKLAYNSQGIAFIQPKDKWPALPTDAKTEFDRFTDPDEYKLFVQYLSKEEIDSANAMNTEKDKKLWQAYPKIKAFSLSAYAPTATRALDDKWWNYAHGAAIADKETTWAFIPSLGLAFSSPDSANFEAPPDGADREAAIASLKEKKWLIEAGTDCLGFVERSIAYQNNKYQWIIDWPIKLAWTQLNANNGSKNVWDSMKTVSRKYPSEYSNLIFKLNTKDVSTIIDTNNPKAPSEEYKALGRIVPGDIFVYTGNGHIGIVSRIEYKDGKLKDIWLIESTSGLLPQENNPYAQGVIKWRSLAKCYVINQKRPYGIFRFF